MDKDNRLTCRSLRDFSLFVSSTRPIKNRLMLFEVNPLHYRALIRRFDWVFCYFRSNNDNWFSSYWIHFCINLILYESFERFFFCFVDFDSLNLFYLMSKFEEAK